VNISEFKNTISKYVLANEPFLFIVDYKLSKPFVCKLDEAEKYGLLYDVKGNSNLMQTGNEVIVDLEIQPIDQTIYSKAFASVIDNIKNGNTYLLNLTFPSRVASNLNLKQLFEVSKAPYKLCKEDEFVLFSPECFVQIKGDFIYSYPMKGTIDANIKNAEEKLLNNSKELWEHNTIVDLIRNDLSMVASDVTVTKFRYVEKIKTTGNDILQTSSEIRGKLPKCWKETFGDMIFKLLPAGSISGAPKQKTVEIIETVELVPRGFYTGVFGVFDGENFDSAVCIRFIEKKGKELYYKSGGGITFMSNENEEYQELINKIYVPII